MYLQFNLGIRPHLHHTIPLTKPALFRGIAEFGVDHVLSFLSTYEDSYESEVNSLRQRAATETEDADYLADERYLLDQVRDLSLQLATVALHRIVEINTQKVLRWRWPDEYIRRKHLYRADRLHVVLKDELSVDVTRLKGFATVDELRRANNAVKHEAKVTEGLAEYSGWNVGEALAAQQLLELLDRAQLEIPGYINAFATAVIPKTT